VTSPALAALRRLLRNGFRREPILDENGQCEVVYFVRDWRGVREVVLVYSEDEARGYRTRFIVDPNNPLYVDPDTAEWLIPLDDVVTVVHALLSLPPSPEPQPRPRPARHLPPADSAP
jgi:hypothetical protein